MGFAFALGLVIVACSSGTPPADTGTSSSSGAAGASSGVAGSSGASSSSTSSGSPGSAGLLERTAGCGKPATVSGTSGTNGTTASSRKYVYFVPTGYDPARAYPLVFTLHGSGATGAQMAAYIKMQDYVRDNPNTPSGNGNAIAVFPTAVGGDWDFSGTSDLLFFDTMVTDLSAALCVNQTRVFALGFSRGAYMANHLGCARAGKVKAIAAADGGFPDSAAGCGKLPALVYHRDEDDVVLVAEGRKARDAWVGIDACTMQTSPTLDAALNCVKYGCAPGADVLWCEDTATSPYKHDLRAPYRVPIWNWFNARP